MNIVDFIIEYELGTLSDDQIIEFFQEIIDSGMVWSLQGSYRRMAKHLIDNGYCTN